MYVFISVFVSRPIDMIRSFLITISSNSLGSEASVNQPEWDFQFIPVTSTFTRGPQQLLFYSCLSVFLFCFVIVYIKNIGRIYAIA